MILLHEPDRHLAGRAGGEQQDGPPVTGILMLKVDWAVSGSGQDSGRVVLLRQSVDVDRTPHSQGRRKGVAADLPDRRQGRVELDLAVDGLATSDAVRAEHRVEAG